MSAVVLVKAFQGTVEAVELHPDSVSAWGSLRDYVGAPHDADLQDWYCAWGATDPSAWYDHDNYGDCRVLVPVSNESATDSVLVFRDDLLSASCEV